MLKNAYLLAKIGADTAENERNFAESGWISDTTPVFLANDSPPKTQSDLCAAVDACANEPQVHREQPPRRKRVKHILDVNVQMRLK